LLTLTWIHENFDPVYQDKGNCKCGKNILWDEGTMEKTSFITPTHPTLELYNGRVGVTLGLEVTLKETLLV